MTTLNLDALHLDTGQHAAPEAGMCLLEATALFAGGPFTDRPACVSEVLTSFGIDLNDKFDDERRQRLKQFIPLLPGTAGDGLDGTRGLLALDWLVRTHTPAFLDLRPELAEHAAALRRLPEIVDLATAQAAGSTVRAAGDTAWAAAGDVAGAAAWDAASAATEAAAAAGAAAVTAAGAAARDAAKAAAVTAAGPAGWDVAGVAAAAAARNAAWDAARDAARASAVTTDAAALLSTVDWLRDSAVDLFARMINPMGDRP